MTQVTQVHEIEQSASEANGLSILKGLYLWLCENASRVEAHEAERHILDRVLAVAQEAMRSYIEHKGTGDVGPKLVDDDGQAYERRRSGCPRDR